MLSLLLAIFTLYILIKISLSFVQIRYILQKKDAKAVLLEQDHYKEAADYAIAKEKLSLVSHSLDYALFLWWTLFGFGILYSFLQLQFSEFWTSIIFLFGYFALEYIITLPISVYQVFYLDKRFGFSVRCIKGDTKDFFPRSD